MTEKEKLIELVRNLRGKITAWHTAEDIADHLIANGVTFPVRCKDCRFFVYRNNGIHGCYLTFVDGYKLDDFCSCGERKENESNS